MNKRGFLLGEETVKIILAVIAIFFLVLFIVYLYNNFSSNKELENAKSSLTHLTDAIKSGATQVEIYNPKDWVFSSYSSSDSVLIPGAANQPKQCSNNKWNNCLCLCTSPGGAVKTFLVACDNKGTCVQNDFRVNGGSISISNPPMLLSIDQQTKTISKAA